MLFGAVTITISMIINVLHFKAAKSTFLYYLLGVGVVVPLIIHDIDMVWFQGRLGYAGWFYIYPLFTFFLMGEKKGLIATSSILSLILVMFLVKLPFAAQTVMIKTLKTQFIVSFVGITAIAYVYERIRRTTQDSLFIKQEHLKISEASLKTEY